MSDPQKYNPVYSASDLQKYWKGELPAHEMHTLERAAQEDPFLADALEGMAAYDTRQDLHELRERLAARVSTSTGNAATAPPASIDYALPPTGQPAPTGAKTRPLLSPWIRIAAAVVLALGLGWTAYYVLNNSTGKAPLAESVPVYKPVQKNTPPSAAATISTDSKAPAKAPPATAPSTTTSPARRDNHVSSTSPAVAADRTETAAAAPSGPPVQANKADAGTAFLDQARTDSATASPNSTVSRQFLSRAAPVANGYSSFNHANPVIFSGKVLDENNNPLAGASLFVKGTGYSVTQTDKNGLFSLRFVPLAKDSIANRMLTVSYKGYEQASIDLSTLNSEQVFGNIIHLQPQGYALNEVVVTGYGAKRRETLAEAPSVSEVSIDSLGLRAAPVEGMTIYRAYLETAKKNLPVDTTIKGTEIISFEVNRKGELSAFKIEQSLSPAHDAGVIRMIKEGPTWRLIKGRTTRAAVRVSF